MFSLLIILSLFWILLGGFFGRFLVESAAYYLLIGWWAKALHLSIPEILPEKWLL